ncbi:NUDIX hydrolase [Terrabacter terrigena]|uniref:NUDIX hydrolase n=1 Tax=Terrabacter terrigena TaxID=574718 RepID=A0ABW3MTA7_9MICO
MVSGIAYAGSSGSIDPAPTPGRGPLPRPAWMDRAVQRLESFQPEWFARFAPPDESARESAVLILFGPPPAGADGSGDGADADGAVEPVEPGEHVVLIERSHTMRTQPAQIAFPGGSRDPEDPDLVATALREAQEETGVDPAGVDVVVQLPPIFLAPAQFVVTPVLAWWARPSPIGVRDPAEVHDVLSVPVSHLVEPATRFSVTHPSGYVGPGFDLDDLFLWGFTAGLVSSVLELGGLSRPWDAEVQRPLPERFLGGRR